MTGRVYIGHLSSRATERDIEHFFKGFGRIRDVVLKNGFGFVEFDDSRDADDAVHDLNGRELCGERVVVEMSKGRPQGGGGGFGGGGGGRGTGCFNCGREGHMSRECNEPRGGRGGFDRYGGGGRGGGGNSRFGPPVQTRHRLLVTNLSTRCSWQDLKDLMRGAGEVAFADAHKKVPNEGIICFTSSKDLRRAMEKYQGKDINGRKIKLIDDSDGGGRRSRSRSPRRASRSKSRSRSQSRSRSPRSRSKSSRGSRSASRSRSASPKRNGRPSRSRSPPSAHSEKEAAGSPKSDKS